MVNSHMWHGGVCPMPGLTLTAALQLGPWQGSEVTLRHAVAMCATPHSSQRTAVGCAGFQATPPCREVSHTHTHMASAVLARCCQRTPSGAAASRLRSAPRAPHDHLPGAVGHVFPQAQLLPREPGTERTPAHTSRTSEPCSRAHSSTAAAASPCSPPCGASTTWR